MDGMSWYLNLLIILFVNSFSSISCLVRSKTFVTKFTRMFHSLSTYPSPKYCFFRSLRFQLKLMVHYFGESFEIIEMERKKRKTKMICLRGLNFIAVVLLALLCGVESGYVIEGLTPVPDGLNANNVFEIEEHHREKRSENVGYLDRVSKYLTENLNIEFDRLVNKTIGEVYDGNDKFEARKKDKGGLSAVLLAAIMMKKMLAAIGIGAVGVLAAKALGVATMALVLTAILGLKKLTESDHKSEPEVHYVKAHQSKHIFFMKEVFLVTEGYKKVWMEIKESCSRIAVWFERKISVSYTRNVEAATMTNTPNVVDLLYEIENDSVSLTKANRSQNMENLMELKEVLRKSFPSMTKGSRHLNEFLRVTKLMIEISFPNVRHMRQKMDPNKKLKKSLKTIHTST
ncbi:hypothetical protein Bhyg_10358 [Pseudolycoriella hygida]|uniref:Uncharacterized protein n=1 Tax=Pseudolycoriella hygida TaxID=35572 RepID=A0A9Q0MTD5_9DIPT|nr:hypothetical protein Bhyg_10358 [Pseudolycoriella hygida]